MHCSSNMRNKQMEIKTCKILPFSKLSRTHAWKWLIFLISRIRVFHWKYTPLVAKMGSSAVYVLAGRGDIYPRHARSWRIFKGGIEQYSILNSDVCAISLLYQCFIFTYATDLLRLWCMIRYISNTLCIVLAYNKYANICPARNCCTSKRLIASLRQVQIRWEYSVIACLFRSIDLCRRQIPREAPLQSCSFLPYISSGYE